MSQVDNAQTVELQKTDGKKSYLDLNVTSTDTTAIESFKQASLISEKAFEKSVDISNASFDYATGIAVFLALCATGLAYWFGVRSFKLTKQSFDSLIQQIQSSERSTSESNKMLILAQEDLKIKELKILNRNNNLNKLRELIANNLFLAGNLQNQIEIGIEEIRIGSPDKFYHSRNFGEFKAVLNSYQSSINQLTVYLGNDSSYSDDLKKYFRKIQLLSWSFYTADINEKALRSSLDHWCGEYKIGVNLIEAYLKYEFDKIHE